MIKIQNISKVFGNLRILENINLEVKEGEFITIIGPNGCGKTTLFNILAGLEKYEGVIKFNKKPKISMIFQNYRDSLLPWRTVLGNITFLQESNLHKSNKINLEIIGRLMHVLNIWKFRNYHLYNLSGGMQQKVAIARSFAYKPNILLMDEPFSALDYFTSRKLEQELLHIWEENKITTLFISHDIDQAIFLADRVIVLSNIPARIKEIININLPRPRSFSMLQKEEFGEIRNRILNLFENEDKLLA